MKLLIRNNFNFGRDSTIFLYWLVAFVSSSFAEQAVAAGTISIRYEYCQKRGQSQSEFVREHYCKVDPSTKIYAKGKGETPTGKIGNDQVYSIDCSEFSNDQDFIFCAASNSKALYDSFVLRLSGFKNRKSVEPLMNQLRKSFHQRFFESTEKEKLATVLFKEFEIGDNGGFLLLLGNPLISSRMTPQEKTMWVWFVRSAIANPQNFDIFAYPTSRRSMTQLTPIDHVSVMHLFDDQDLKIAEDRLRESVTAKKPAIIVARLTYLYFNILRGIVNRQSQNMWRLYDGIYDLTSEIRKDSLSAQSDSYLASAAKLLGDKYNPSTLDSITLSAELSRRLTLANTKLKITLDFASQFQKQLVQLSPELGALQLGTLVLSDSLDVVDGRMAGVQKWELQNDDSQSAPKIDVPSFLKSLLAIPLNARFEADSKILSFFIKLRAGSSAEVASQSVVDSNLDLAVYLQHRNKVQNDVRSSAQNRAFDRIVSDIKLNQLKAQSLIEHLGK